MFRLKTGYVAGTLTVLHIRIHNLCSLQNQIKMNEMCHQVAPMGMMRNACKRKRRWERNIKSVFKK
jgi:hypothetical protein